MKKTKECLPELILIGQTVKTNNVNEMQPGLSKIAQLSEVYWSQGIASQFHHRLNPGVTYSVYTDFESDEHGDYTYFIGERIDCLDDQDLDQFETLIIPASQYIKLTTEQGSIPEVVVGAWKKIWAMDQSDFEGTRTYKADFEIYDQKASDPNNAVVDIYIGIH